MEDIDGRQIGSYASLVPVIGGFAMGWKRYQEDRGLTFMGKQLNASSPITSGKKLTDPIVKINSSTGVINSSIKEAAKRQAYRTQIDRIGTMADSAVAFMEGRLSNPVDIAAASSFREEALFALQRTLSDPSLQGKFGELSPHEIMSRATGSSIEELSTQYKTLLGRGDEVSRVLKRNISEELVDSFAREKPAPLETRRGKTFYNENAIRNPLTEFDTVNLTRKQVPFEQGLGRAKTLPGFEGLQRFVSAANEERVRRGYTKNPLTLDRPTKAINFIESNMGGSRALYAEVDAGAGLGKVMFPLQRPEVQTMGGKLPLYLSSRHATGAVSYIGNYMHVEPGTPTTQGGYAGAVKSNTINEAERIFWGTDSRQAMIVDALKAEGAEGTLESRMIGKFADAPSRTQPHQFGHHVPLTPGGLASAAARHSMAHIEASDPDWLKAKGDQIVRSLMASDPNIRPIGSPSQIGGKGMVFLDSNQGPLNMFSPELKDALSGARRPLQAMSNPYQMMNADFLDDTATIRAEGHPRLGGDIVYSPVRSSMFNPSYYREMMKQGVAAFTTPRIFTIKEQAHNLVGEGQFLYDQDQLLRNMGLNLESLREITRTDEGAVRKYLENEKLVPGHRGDVTPTSDEINQEIRRRQNYYQQRVNAHLPSYLAPAGTFSISMGGEGSLSAAPDERVLRLMEIANRVESGDPVEQRNALIRAANEDPTLQFSRGDVLGQSPVGERGVSDVRANVGDAFKGKLIATSIAVQDGMVRIGFGGQLDGIDGIKTFLNKEVGQRITPAQRAEIERSLGIESDSFRNVGLYARGGELLKEGQLAHVRTQQATAGKRLLASRLGMIQDGTYTDRGTLIDTHQTRRGQDILRNFLDSDESTSLQRLRSLGEQRRGAPSLASLVSSRTGIDEEILRRSYLIDELEGTVRGVHAFERTFTPSRFSSQDLGMVFGVEGPAGKEGLVNLYRTALGDQGDELLRTDLARVLGTRSDDFVNRLILGATTATTVYGEAPGFARDTVGAYKSSPQAIERRAIETLSALDEWDLKGHSNTKILLQAIRKSSTILDEREAGALGRLTRGLESLDTMNFDQALGVEKIKGDAAGTQRLNELIEADTRKAIALDIGDTRTFIPSSEDLNTLRSPIGIGDDSYLAGEIERKASMVLKRAHDLGLDPDNQDTLAALRAARTEYQDQIARARALPYLRSINPTMETGHYIMATASAQPFKESTTDLLTRGIISMQDESGVTARISPERYNEMLRSMERVASSAEDMETIQRYRAQAAQGRAVPFMFSRSPADSPGAVQLGSVVVDSSVKGLEWNQARLTMQEDFLGFKKGESIDITPVRAAALTADLDGDRVLAALLLTGNVKLDNDLLDHARTIAQSNLTTQTDRIIGMEFFDKQFKQVASKAAAIGEGPSANINEEIARRRTAQWTKLRQSRDIGLLATSLGQLDSIAKESLARGDISLRQYNAISAMNYTMLQQAVSFKHGTGGLAQEITRQVSHILEHSTNVGEDLNEFYRSRFGDLSQHQESLSRLGIDVSRDYTKIGEAVNRVRGQGFRDAWNRLFKMGQKHASAITEEDLIEVRAISAELDTMHSRLLQESFEAQGADSSAIRNLVDQARTQANLQGGAIKTGIGGNWKVAAPWAMGGLIAGSMLYGLSNVGYSSSALDAPPTPDGRPGMTNMAVRMAIADGSLLDSTGSAERHINRNQIPEQQPTYTGSNMPIQNTINNNVHLQNPPAGNIAMNTQVHSQEATNQLIHALHSRIPHGQIGVNVNHRSYVPSDMQQLM